MIETNLGQITFIRTGKLDANAQDINGKYPFFTCGEENLTINEAAFDTEAVLLAGNGNFSVKYYKGKFNAYQRTYVIEPNQINGKWLYYLLAHHIAKITTGARGSTIKYLRIGDITDCAVNLVPIKHQELIAAKIEELLSELDKGIENLKTAQAQLKVYRHAVLKHAFEGKVTAQWRAENKAKLETAEVLQKRIQSVHTQHYQQQLSDWETTGKIGNKPKAPSSLPPLTKGELAELPNLPAGWGWVRFGDIFSNSPKNGVYKSADFYGEGISIIRIDDFYDGALRRTAGFKRVKLSSDEIMAFTANAGDILINRVNSIEYLGKCCEIKGLQEPVVFESNIMKTRVLSSLASNFYVTSYLSSYFGRGRLCSNAKHAVNQASINQTDVSMTPIPLVQLDEQFVISEYLSAQFTEIDQLDQAIITSLRQAEALHQSILKKAFSGQLVPQDPNDEPAAELLARIEASKVMQTKSSRKAK